MNPRGALSCERNLRENNEPSLPPWTHPDVLGLGIWLTNAVAPQSGPGDYGAWTGCQKN